MNKKEDKLINKLFKNKKYKLGIMGDLDAFKKDIIKVGKALEKLKTKGRLKK